MAAPGKKGDDKSPEMHQTATSRTSILWDKPDFDPFAELGLPVDARRPPSLETVARAWRGRVNAMPKPIDQSLLVKLNRAKALMNETSNWSQFCDWS